ncbi:SRPBCC domain-containing protein [Candidatus Methanocrinis natronophilus]|uniref:SRPBCC domain-containing protein n=1 Tax=Candidatus Methanocrinis natronophilus TaxID=3033396 RepID=A0ABT5X4E6_9EURY|nr:SRPBCC domain-containing protein [Candidatus Methanocrinis natronophilus]MDF0589578.1 SRPBCC domain-containing protein [Candidatus Methanocrinis natronophilus]
MFREEISDEIEVLAGAGAVWRVLTDFEGYSEWNTFIRPVVGAAEVGARLRVQVRPPGGRAMAFRPRLTAVVPQRELRWKGWLWAPGLLDGEHVFEIEPLGPDKVRFVQREIFRGLLVPLVSKKTLDQIVAGFGDMNRALKERVEESRSIGP